MTYLQRKYLLPLVILAAVLLAVWICSESIYAVAEDEFGVLLRLNNPIFEHRSPGLHMKIPFVDDVITLPQRVQSWEGRTVRRETRDKVPVHVKGWALWRINKPLEFLRTVKTVEGAREKLDRILEGAIGEVVASFNLVELVRSSQQPLEPAPETQPDVQAPATQPGGLRELPAIELGQTKLVQRIREEIQRRVLEPAGGPGLSGSREYGFVVVDFGLIRIMHPEDHLEQRVFKPMRAEQESGADIYLQEAERRSQEILGQAEQYAADRAREANRWIEVLQGQTAAELERQRNRVLHEAADLRRPGELTRVREFIRYVEWLEALKESLAGKAELILTTDADFLRLLKEFGFDPPTATRPQSDTGDRGG